ncbi:hypothetical protein [Terriglobus sp.]|uniref:hypothetical protein n=1 Tax=Terriglobus sp. TaxID=1889013 RepID=UPI003AFF9B55
MFRINVRKLFGVGTLLLLMPLGVFSQEQPLSVTASIREPEVKVGGKVGIWLALQNRSDHELVYMDQARECDYGVQLRSAETNLPIPMLPGVREHCSATGGTTRNITVRIKPGESRRDRINLEDLFDLSAPGAYTVRVTRQLPGVTAGPAISNDVQFQIIP